MLNFIVTDQNIEFSGITLDKFGDLIVSGSANIYLCHFEFNDSWSDFTKTAVFITDNNDCDINSNNEFIILDDDNNCYIPASIIKNQGKLRVGVYGVNGSQHMPTVYSKNFLVRMGAVPDGIIPPEQQTIYEQLLEKYNQAFLLIQDLSGGTTGQFLVKNSDNDYDFDWNDGQGQVPIKTISVNGEEQPIVDENVDITVPTKTSDLENDSGFLTEHQSLSAYRTKSQQDAIDIFKANKTDVTAINAKIPAQASSSNQLADKSFVNSSIGTNTANYISNDGQPFESVAQLEAYTGTVTNNDYAFVTGTDEQGNTYFDRYKATVSGSAVTWAKEYRLNNSSFSAEQWAAISSGITSGLVALISTSLQPSDLTPYRTAEAQDVIDNGKLDVPEDVSNFYLNLDGSTSVERVREGLRGITFKGKSYPLFADLFYGSGAFQPQGINFGFSISTGASLISAILNKNETGFYSAYVSSSASDCPHPSESCRGFVLITNKKTTSSNNLYAMIWLLAADDTFYTGYIKNGVFSGWEEMAKDSEVVKGVKVGGTELTKDAEGKVSVPNASASALGVVKANATLGTYINGNGEMYLYAAEAGNIANRTSKFVPIVPYNLNTAVKAALSDANRISDMTDAEKKNAREVIGITSFELIEEITLTEDVAEISRTKTPLGDNYAFRDMVIIIEFAPNDADSSSNVQVDVNGIRFGASNGGNATNTYLWAEIRYDGIEGYNSINYLRTQPWAIRPVYGNHLKSTDPLDTVRIYTSNAGAYIHTGAKIKIYAR